MDTGRSGIVLPGRKTVPWKKLGQHFAAHMPDEIDELLSAVTVSSSSFDAELAKLLDADWMKKLDPVKVPTKAKEGEPLIGDDPGEAMPPGDDYPESIYDGPPTKRKQEGRPKDSRR